jgi:hypothetical protein
MAWETMSANLIITPSNNYSPFESILSAVRMELKGACVCCRVIIQSQFNKHAKLVMKEITRVPNFFAINSTENTSERVLGEKLHRKRYLARHPLAQHAENTKVSECASPMQNVQKHETLRRVIFVRLSVARCKASADSTHTQKGDAYKCNRRALGAVKLYIGMICAFGANAHGVRRAVTLEKRKLPHCCLEIVTYDFAAKCQQYVSQS